MGCSEANSIYMSPISKTGCSEVHSKSTKIEHNSSVQLFSLPILLEYFHVFKDIHIHLAVRGDCVVPRLIGNVCPRCGIGGRTGVERLLFLTLCGLQPLTVHQL